MKGLTLMITTNLLSIIVNALEVPEPFAGIFTAFWVFFIVAFLVVLLVIAGTIIGFVFLFRAILKRSKESEDTFEQKYAEANKETAPIKCEFCGRKMKHSEDECPNCGAQVWTD